jgi:hypothetical protein
MVKRSKTVISFCFEAKQSKKRLFRFALKRNEKIWNEMKHFWKQNKAKIRSINFSSVGSIKFEEKRSEKKLNFFCFTWACETHAKRTSFRFVSLWSEKIFCETGVPYSWSTRKRIYALSTYNVIYIQNKIVEKSHRTTAWSRHLSL